MMQIDIEEKDNVAVISVTGELSLHGIGGFEKAFAKYPGSDFDVIALDLKHMPYIDSFGISRIIKVSRMFIADNKKFVLINMNENVHHLFKMSTFDRLFNIMTGNEFEHEFLTPEIPVKNYKAEHIEESQDQINNKKIKEVELVDDNGTTLIFIDE